MEQLTSIPGIEATAARASLAEIGTEMRHVGSAARLASWAEVCPGHDERAGRTRKGNRDLCRVLVQCVWAARNTPTFPGHTCRRLEGCLGGKKAAMAVAHKMLVIGYHLLLEGTCDEEARDDHLQDRPEEHQQQCAVKALVLQWYLRFCHGIMIPSAYMEGGMMMPTIEQSASPSGQDLPAVQGGAAYLSDIERRLAPYFERSDPGSGRWPLCVGC